MRKNQRAVSIALRCKNSKPMNGQHGALLTGEVFEGGIARGHIHGKKNDSRKFGGGGG